MHTIHLHGHLRRFGARFDLACLNAADAVKALIAQLPGFRQAMDVGEYKIVKRRAGEARQDYDESELSLGLGESCALHFVPVPAGAKSGGIGKVVLGAVITAVAIGGALYTGGASLTAFGGAAFGVSSAFTWGSMAALGGLMMLSGVAQLTAPTAKVKTGERADERRSFLLSGQLESSVQGQPVPVVYGRYRVPLTIISAGIAPEAI